MRKIDFGNDDMNFILPITPLVKYTAKAEKTSQILFGFGEIPTGQSIELLTWKFDGLIPYNYENYMDYLSSIGQGDFIVWVRYWMEAGSVLHFRVTDDDIVVTDYKCTIDGFEYGEEDGTLDLKYNLSFTEYRELEISNRKIVENLSVTTSYGDTYTVEEGDTLLTIAQAVYGDSNYFKKLMNNNNILNPFSIAVGQELKL